MTHFGFHGNGFKNLPNDGAASNIMRGSQNDKVPACRHVWTYVPPSRRERSGSRLIDSNLAWWLRSGRGESRLRDMLIIICNAGAYPFGSDAGDWKSCNRTPGLSIHIQCSGTVGVQCAPLCRKQYMRCIAVDICYMKMYRSLLSVSSSDSSLGICTKCPSIAFLMRQTVRRWSNFCQNEKLLWGLALLLVLQDMFHRLGGIPRRVAISIYDVENNQLAH
ncbi:uncharacterized protein BO96DRAFT_436313 [Aspergillus niger CBS 101883]|uniref:Uncharacterized protein n=2 Tax=Aspergillus niger TaxID=5061 RepID=A2R4Y3_ASPNC|nr:uncharacterized protein BO96DRAFT_436313 [Aspergillus niger CBS 101883]XP_059602455.1 hypothetical protein An15g02020 [Aspergillus niger]PYH54262.1 hypothetical protein BO96DRAFT_436313 [Aspergillus niger CBS 101883]CAK42305.1 hypothetical protein An15g02020 [Aspergillus niger]